MGSSISAAPLALYDRLEESAALEGVQKTFGPPAAHEAPEVVALLGIKNPDEEARQLGNVGSRREKYWIKVGIKVADQTATDPRTVWIRGFEVADAVRAVSGLENNNLNLGGVGGVRTCQPISTETVYEDGVVPLEGGGWVILINVIFEVHADTQN